jgi:hypothetical protein
VLVLPLIQLWYIWIWIIYVFSRCMFSLFDALKGVSFRYIWGKMVAILSSYWVRWTTVIALEGRSNMWTVLEAKGSTSITSDDDDFFRNSVVKGFYTNHVKVSTNIVLHLHVFLTVCRICLVVFFICKIKILIMAIVVQFFNPRILNKFHHKFPIL